MSYWCHHIFSQFTTVHIYCSIFNTSASKGNLVCVLLCFFWHQHKVSRPNTALSYSCGILLPPICILCLQWRNWRICFCNCKRINKSIHNILPKRPSMFSRRWIGTGFEKMNKMKKTYISRGVSNTVLTTYTKLDQACATFQKIFAKKYPLLPSTARQFLSRAIFTI